ncbi:MAG: ATP-binding protein [Capsulimonadales bacterium]|nr:ATP-binding protein [Capsulimonadales bacterium]
MINASGHSASPGPPDGPETQDREQWTVWIMPVLTLVMAYGLLFLTFAEKLDHAEVMKRCVLSNDQYARIWSVGNVEIGLAYLGVFGTMLFYFLKIYRNSALHLRDLTFALSYLLGSFILDYICVKTFEPFPAMLIGDGLVMTFTLIVSRQVWFQRLLGVFVPMIFLTCGIGHLLEGLSYWKLTYEWNVPWTMVTADIGFAVLVNSSRYPAFIRGEDILSELKQERDRADRLTLEVEARQKAEAENLRLMEEIRQTTERQRRFLRDVLASVTEGRLRYCEVSEDLPPRPDGPFYRTPLDSAERLRELRREIIELMRVNGFSEERIEEAQMAAQEGAMNALVHGQDGQAAVYLVENEAGPHVQVWVEDRGRGIDMENLPRATLEPGFSSAGTLGQGFKLMLRTADTVWIRTNRNGTTVVIEKGREPRPNPLLS